jgi:hypothetical protein
MHAPPPTGTTGNAPPPVVLLGAGEVAVDSLEEALAAVAAAAGGLGAAAPQPTNRMNSTVPGVAARGRLRGRGWGSILRMVVAGSRAVVDGTGAGEATDAPTVEADNAATGVRQRRKPGGNHRQSPAAGKTTGIRWGRRHFAGQSARRRRV